MIPTDNEKTDQPERTTSDTVSTAETKQAAARRRFLRMGAGGSAAVLVTIVHKRALASGIKKGSLISRCASLNGTVDLKNATSKKPLEASIGGTYKNLTCNIPGTPNITTCNDPEDLEDKKYLLRNWKVFPKISKLSGTPPAAFTHL